MKRLLPPFCRLHRSSRPVPLNTQRRQLSSSSSQRVYKAYTNERQTWNERIADLEEHKINALLQRVHSQEVTGGRMRARMLGVLHEDPVIDMELLTKNYTVPALASALRDREDALQSAAVLAEENRIPELLELLRIHHPKYVQDRRRRRQHHIIDKMDLEVLRKTLMRMPRTVVSAHSSRAAVVVPLCLVDGVPSLLLEKRSPRLRAHPDEVCLPGGMVCTINDKTIVETCLREMNEEIGGLQETDPQVLGVFRCNWGEVHHLVGVAVTPVVVYLGDLPDLLQPNPDEVAEVFTISLSSLIDSSLWHHKEDSAPIFLGGPHIIWGLTGYILHRFVKDILLPNSRASDEE